MSLQNLKPGEEKILKDILHKEASDLQGNLLNRSLDKNVWPDEAVVRADFLRNLLAFPDDLDKSYKLSGLNSSKISDSLKKTGLDLSNAKIVDVLDICRCKISFPVKITNSLFVETIRMKYAKFTDLKLNGSKLSGLEGEGASFSGDLSMAKGFVTDDSIVLTNCTFGGRILCTQGTFKNDKANPPIPNKNNCVDCWKYVRYSYSLDIARSNIDGDVHLCGDFNCRGGVNLADVTINGNLNCTRAYFKAKDIKSTIDNQEIGRRLQCESQTQLHQCCALNAEGIRVGGYAVLNKSTFIGGIRFTQGKVEKDFEAAEVKFYNNQKVAFHGDRLEVAGNMFISDGAKIVGAIRLSNALVGADLNLYKLTSYYAKPNQSSIFLRATSVKGSFYLIGSTIQTGCVDFTSARIDENVDCSGARLNTSGSFALKADFATVKGNFYFANPTKLELIGTCRQIPEEVRFIAKSRVSLEGIHLDGNLVARDCSFNSLPAASLEKLRHFALFVENSRIIGNCVLSGKKFRACGGLSITEAKIGGNLECSSAQFIAFDQSESKNSNLKDLRYSIAAGHLKVGGSIYCDNEFTSRGVLCFNDAVIGRNLTFKNARLINSEYTDSLVRKSIDDHYSFMGSRINVTGLLRLDNLTSIGEFNIDYCTIGTNIECSGATLLNYNFLKEPIECKKFLNFAFRANGSAIKGDINFNNPDSADTAKQQTTIIGVVSFEKSIIGLCLHWKNIINHPDATLYNYKNKGFALNLEGTKVTKFDDDQESWPAYRHLLISSFEYETLQETTERQAVSANSEITHAVFSSQGNSSKSDQASSSKISQYSKKYRLDWLKRAKTFSPHSYNQLAKVYDHYGYHEKSRTILIEKSRLLRWRPVSWLTFMGESFKTFLDRYHVPRKRKLPYTRQGIVFTSYQSLGSWLWLCLTGLLTRYGLRPMRSLFIGGLLIFAGWGLFYYGFADGYMVTSSTIHGNIYQIASVTEEEDDNSFKIASARIATFDKDWQAIGYSLFYSIDTFIPVLTFDTDNFWLPTAHFPEEEKKNKDKMSEQINIKNAVSSTTKSQTQEAISYSEGQSEPEGYSTNDPQGDSVSEKSRTMGLILCGYRWFLIVSGWVITLVFITAIGNSIKPAKH